MDLIIDILILMYMPAPCPPVGTVLEKVLRDLGKQLRAQRKRLGVTATDAAEAAGMSRVTLHRIERGEASVAMGAYISVIYSLGLRLELTDENQRKKTPKQRSLQLPSLDDRICGVATLSALDMGATKLLANSDRWADDALFTRDLIDLAMLELPRPLLLRAKEKAAAAYGDSVERDLEKAIQSLKSRSHRLDECMEALKMDSVPKALLWKRIRKLRSATPK